MRKSPCLNVESLEVRDALSASSVLLNAGVLSIVVEPDRSHTVVVSNPATGGVQVQLDAKLYNFAGPVTEVNYVGNDRGDKFTNLTSIGGTLSLGDGDNIVLSRASNKILAGNGDNVIQDQAGGSTIIVGNGDNNIYGGPNDTITAGKGDNVIYSILGPASVSIAPDRGRDYVFVSAAGTVTGATDNDLVGVFFAANRQPGSGSLVLEAGVLYFTANNSGNQYLVNRVGNKIVVTYNLGDGNGFQTRIFNRNEVKLIANFGGAGSDTFINNTDVPDIQYGAGGSNLLIGGFGPLNLLKAGGAAGTSIAIGRSPVYNDLNGSGNTTIVTTMILNPQAETNIVRTNNPADVIFGFDNGDVFVSPFKLKWRR